VPAQTQAYTGRIRKGRFIRHALTLALAVIPLAVAMILTSFGTLLMATVSLAALETEGFLTAAETAITLAAITVAAEIEHRRASRQVAQALAKDGGTSDRHRFREGALDNRRRS